MKRLEKRKSTIAKNDRITVRMPRHLYPYVVAYAKEHGLYIEESMGELLNKSIAREFVPGQLDPKPGAVTRVLNKFRRFDGRTQPFISDLEETPSQHDPSSRDSVPTNV